jgi:hypothetical protein
MRYVVDKIMYLCVCERRVDDVYIHIREQELPHETRR